MKKLIEYLKIGGFWLLLLAIIGAVSEVCMRLFSYEGKFTVQYYFHNAFGIWRTPNQMGTKVGGCYEANTILVNSFGVRGREPDALKPIKVGFFGDSMLEGLQVTENDHFITKLNEANDSVDYMNFGMSSTCPTYYLLNLRYHENIFHFNKVVVFLFPANDVQESSIPLQIKMNGKRYYFPTFIKNESGHYLLDEDYQPKDAFFDFKNMLKKSLVFTKLYDIQVFLQQRRITSAPVSAGGGSTAVPFASQVYIKNLPPEWEEAFQIMEFSIEQIKQFCEARSIPLVFALIPSVGELLNEEEFSKNAGNFQSSIDRYAPYERLKKFLSERNLAYLDFYEIFRDHISRNQLKYPYFSYECDGHFAPLGHEVLFAAFKAAGF